ncbi:response regulator transcription factor [Promicromonospora sukumoe]|uniref:DNA-binding NarL/FixJ family response regulator n=1 Tax=Promicromonospora sukumoe TaxID=88382 RepID=A0A7W3J7M9_9MICO|nr:response regulator transcription factor [Promicromonospora sukumoe]MBA8807790.1 DNA-binding NarL/FixJ family response regulator [Promicromonospora sukumoe]
MTAPDTTGPVSVLLVDDDPMVRRGLRLVLGGDPGLTIVGEAGDGAEGMAQIQRLDPDVVLLDIRMPVLDGLAVLARLRDRGRPGPRVVVLTTFHTDDDVLAALADGAAGFLLKDADPLEMIAAVKAVHRGDPALSPAVATTVIAAAAGRRRVDPEVARAAAALTGREREAAVLMARGLSNAEIGTRMHLSLATVKANLTRVFAKLAVDNRVSAAMAVRDAGLLDEV